MESGYEATGRNSPIHFPASPPPAELKGAARVLPLLGVAASLRGDQSYGLAMSINLDSVQECALQLPGGVRGRSSGTQISVVTKSCTSDFHAVPTDVTATKG
jgi:hypothetical protein